MALQQAQARADEAEAAHKAEVKGLAAQIDKAGKEVAAAHQGLQESRAKIVRIGLCFRALSPVFLRLL